MPEEYSAGLPAFLQQMLFAQYGEETTRKICDGYAARRAVTLRANTIRCGAEEIAAQLRAAGLDFERISWSKDAFLLQQAREAQVQELPMFELGQIYLQSLSSMLPPIALAPMPGYDILDMAAAPGGKTTEIAAMTGNRAHITACERNAIRAERLKYNLEKQGATSAYVMVADARRLDDFFAFDQILLDAPCSGSGTLRVGSVPKGFTPRLIEKSAETQLALLRKALRLLKPGKEMVYSTCSILAQENEEIVRKALSGGKAELVPIAFDAMQDLPLLPSSLPGTLCVCPDARYEGFFVAKLRKKK